MAVERIIVGIDIGTTKICTLIGQVDDNDSLHVIGIGVVPARGLRRGVVTDIEAASQAVGESVDKAERVAGQTVTQAWVGVGGSHISSQNNRGVVSIGRGDRPVDRDDIERVMESARTITMPHNRRIIHSLPRQFIIDDQDGIKNPLGLMGFRLEVEAHIVTGAVTSIQNLVRCVESNGIQVVDIVLQPLASSEAVLTDAEKKMGVVLVDMGGGTTDVAIHVEGSAWETIVFPIGGNHITNDIAIGLRMPYAAAEEIKIRYAHASPSVDNERELIEVATFGDENLRTISRAELCKLVVARTEEMFSYISREVKRSGLDSLLPAGVVLTGGTASLTGIRDLAARTLQVPVRIGAPRRLRGLVEAVSSPAYATGVGLLLWGQKAQDVLSDDESGVQRAGTWHDRLSRLFKLLLPRS